MKLITGQKLSLSLPADSLHGGLELWLSTRFCGGNICSRVAAGAIILYDQCYVKCDLYVGAKGHV